MAANTASALSGAWATIPQELKGLRQWLLGAPKDDVDGYKCPKTLDSFNRIVKCSINEPSKFLTFEQVVETALNQHRFGKFFSIGFVLTANDPYTIIDLDNKEENPASEKEIELFKFLIGMFDSYTEGSLSGRGVHIIVKGNSTSNFRRDKVECYSSKRFMIMTGHAIRNIEIADRAEEVHEMTSRMSVHRVAGENAIELDDAGREHLTDAEVHQRARDSANGAKYLSLLSGDLSVHNGDHSACDASLVQFLWFHSRNKAQTVRMFMDTPLGKREKAVTRLQDYVVNRTLGQAMERLAHDEQMAETVSFAEFFLGIEPPRMPAKPDLQLVVNNEPAVEGVLLNIDSMVAAASMRETLYAPSRPVESPVQPKKDGREMDIEIPMNMQHVPAPPPIGRLKRLVDYIHGASMFSKPEIALGGALGMIAGIAGAAYQTPMQATGLAQYFVIVAVSGTGKNSMHTAVQTILHAIESKGVTARGNFDFTEYGSPQALMVTGILKKQANSIVHMSSEWGQQMLAMTKNTNSNAPGIYRRILLEMFDKSAAGSIVQGKSVLGDKDANAPDRGSFAYTILSETNPDTFNASIKADDASDGYMSRMTIIEYVGNRGDRNWNPVKAVPDAVVDDLVALTTQAQTINQAVAAPNGMPNLRGGLPMSGTYQVPFDNYQTQLMFQNMADGINDDIKRLQDAGPEDIAQHIMMRADMRILRTATLMAVYENPVTPQITPDCLQWAQKLNDHCVNTIKRRVANGDIGNGNLKGYTSLLNKMRSYASGEIALKEDKDIALHKHHYVAHAWLRAQLGATFNRLFELRANQEFTAAIQILIDEGRILQLKGPTELAHVGIPMVRGKAYRLVDLS